LRGRSYVLPDDIKHLAPAVMAHRVILKDQERLRGLTPETFLKDLIDEIPVPSPSA